MIILPPTCHRHSASDVCMCSVHADKNLEEILEALKRRSVCVFAFQPADVPKPMSAPGPVLKANSLSNLEQERSTYRYVALIKTPWAAE